MRHGVRQTTQAIGEALASVGSLLGASHSFMWLDGPSESESTNTFEWRADGVPPLPVEFPAVMEHSLPVLLSATSRQGYFRIDEPAALPPGDGSLRHLMESNGLNTLLAVPVSDGTDLTGFVGVLDAQPGARSTHSVTFLRTLSTALSSALERRRADAALRASFESLRSTVEGTVDALSKLGEARDPYTAGHQQRVAEISCAIAEEMGFAPDRIEGIRVASKLHDIGKIHVPGEILSKPGKLNELEFGIIKTHPKVGYDILRAVVFPWPVAKVALQHHERLDGSGYPDGLKGDDILPEAKIVAVSDVVEAMCTHRPYRPALTIEEAIEELASNRGRLYAPEVVDACLKLMRSGKMNPGGGRP
jgi:putative nucleotidyltransferase with HDIG domain